MEEDKKKEEELTPGDGVSIALFFVTLIVLVLFLWSPIAHYLGKWSDYWNQPEERVATEMHVEEPEYWDREAKAIHECEARSDKYFGIAASYATSTSPSAPFTTYDCYAIKYTKIP